MKEINLSGLRFEPLGKHDRAAFACENEALTDYIKKQASQDISRNAAAVYVATLDGNNILGYYTLSQFSIQLDEIPEHVAKKRFAKYKTVSATLLGRLARDISVRGSQTGELLLLDALFRALQLSKRVASSAVVVDAKDETSAAFYMKYGFIQLPNVERRLFIPMATVQQLFPK